ncbi:MAG: toxin co-regulated pilus biosynthesis Q family protein [Rickettsiales bacterium]|jgi:hypothetical protein|nr:toxin co-regulated pilus biosynthesis Q family protein [Rickettsiales bacterium]
MFFCRISAFLIAFFGFAPLFADGGAMPMPPPVWPIGGTDADVQIAPNSAQHRIGAGDENIRIISKIGADLAVENNVNIGGSPGGDSFSGGANLTQSYPAASGFYPYENQAEMPFMHSEMLEDDGASVLSMSKTNRKRILEPRKFQTSDGKEPMTDFAVDSYDEEPAREIKDQVRSWVVASGQNLRDVLQTWCDKEGWDLIWNTPREYPISASAVFKGRFLDVSSALVRNFSRATPIPYAKFYKGNRVLVISTTEDN